jgi:hypothetical protein
MNLFGGNVDLGEDVIVACFIVGLLAVEWDRTLVCKEDFPKEVLDSCN